MTHAYQTAYEWTISVGFDTGGGTRMSKLILSLWNIFGYPFSVGECLSGLDRRGQQLAIEMIRDFAMRGETDSLREVGALVMNRRPDLRQIAAAMMDARSTAIRLLEHEAGSGKD